MKKLLYTLLFVCGFCLTTSAQSKSMDKGITTMSDNAQVEKMNAIKSCGELDNQLKSIFGDSYSLDNKMVLAQLEKNIDDTNASTCIRKNSLYAIFGSDYANHLDRIAPSTKRTLTNSQTN